MNRVTYIENEKGPTPRDVDPRLNARAAAAWQTTRVDLSLCPAGDQSTRSLIHVRAACSLSAIAVKRAQVGITPKQAAHIAGVSPQTVVRWCLAYEIGCKIAGRWIVDRERLAVLLTGGLR